MVNTVNLSKSPCHLQDFLTAAHTALVGHRVRAIGHANTLQDHIIVVLGNDMAARKSVAQHFFDGPGYPLHTLAGAKDINIANLGQIVHLVARHWRSGWLKILVANDQAVTLDPQELERVE